MKAYTYDAVVIGSGAAGLACAVRLQKAGVNVAILTEGMKCGTSRNTGSDKQTYYKLTCAGTDRDSVAEMAKDLYSPGAVDGDNALCEAALSLRCFFALAEGGVPFPHNAFGEYIGYKTDHDPYRRATSAGPLTSKFMTEMWEEKAKSLDIPVLDGYLAVEILKHENKVCGLVALRIATGELITVSSPYVVLATGGPAGIYADSVYPISQNGSMGLAVAAGVTLQNLTEWQYGLASTSPRWNVSGTYMQVLPRFVSVDAEGREHEFLSDYFTDPYEALSLVFLKGYQWPFDCQKAQNGSSLIDLTVYYETSVKKRRVYLDFTKNPLGMKEIDYQNLSPEAYQYLSRADACFGTPIERLFKMNAPAVELYQSKGVDITKEYLEIALCAQHHNGGIAVDKWWQSDLPGLFAIGECAGTHGIARPGGSALNAGQVGALRAAQYIAAHKATNTDAFESVAADAKERHTAFAERLLHNENNVQGLIDSARRSMSDVGSAIRDRDRIDAYRRETEALLSDFESKVGVEKQTLYKGYRYRDILLSQLAVLYAMSDYDARGYSSRGSAILCDGNGVLPSGLPEAFRFRSTADQARDKIQEVVWKNGQFFARFRQTRPLAVADDFFETVWKDYRTGAMFEKNEK